MYVVKVAKWFMLYMPIIVLFYQENGLLLQDVMTLQAIYSAAIVVLEIPSGYLADLWGRRSTILLGSILGVVGFGLYASTSGFVPFLIAELVLGTGQSFISGSDSALLYDSLLVDGCAEHYVKFEGRILSVGNFAETIAALLGSLLAGISLRTPFYCQVIVALTAVPAAIMLSEPHIAKSPSKAEYKRIGTVIKNTLFVHKELALNILYSAIIGCGTLTMAWMLQAYLDKVHGFSETLIGISWTIVNLTVGISTLFAYKIERHVGIATIFTLILTCIGGFYIVMGLTALPVVFVVIWLFYVVRGIATPILKNSINKLTTPDVRATVLSVRNFVIRIFFASTSPLLGWYADTYSIMEALFMAGIAITATGGIALFFYLRQHKKGLKAE